MQSNLLSNIGAADALGHLSLDGLAMIVMFGAAARLIRSPREWFSFGRASKVAWVLACLWFTFEVGDVVVPLGSLMALWHLRSLRRRHSGGQPGELPFARGTRVPRDEQ